MRAKLRCRGCENGREQPRNRICPTCRAIVDEQREAREQQEAAKKITVDRDFLLAVESLLAGLVQQRQPVKRPTAHESTP